MAEVTTSDQCWLKLVHNTVCILQADDEISHGQVDNKHVGERVQRARAENRQNNQQVPATNYNQQAEGQHHDGPRWLTLAASL